jgi:DNA polymerase IV
LTFFARHQLNRGRKSSGSETIFSEDLTDPTQIEAGVIAIPSEFSAWCEKAEGIRLIGVSLSNFRSAERQSGAAERADLFGDKPL